MAKKGEGESKRAEQVHQSKDERGTLHLGRDVKLYPTKEGGHKAVPPKPKK